MKWVCLCDYLLFNFIAIYIFSIVKKWYEISNFPIYMMIKCNYFFNNKYLLKNNTQNKKKMHNFLLFIKYMFCKIENYLYLYSSKITIKDNFYRNI